MLDCTSAYQEAVVGTYRRIMLQAAVEIISPDLVYGTGDSSGEAGFSHLEQLHDDDTGTVPVATLELNRWVLDGSFIAAPEDLQSIPGQHGYASDVICDENGVFASPPWAELRFSGVTVLQFCSVYFPDAELNGLPEDFDVQIMSGGNAVHTQSFTDNTADMVSVSGFTVNSPDAIRVTVYRWSRPYHRMRVVDIYPGMRMKWDNDTLASFNLVQQGSFSAVTLPYGTCSLEIDNSDRMFDPRNKGGLFESMQERQGVHIHIGVDLGDSVEYKKVGTYYQSDGGWTTSKGGLTLKWELVDVIGLLTERRFAAPDKLPTTLPGWISAILAQLGPSFASRYTVAEEYADAEATVTDASAVDGKKCGELLRWVCQATGTWPRAAADTGFLTVGGFWEQGNKVTLDNLNAYPEMRANGDIASIDFTLSDGTQFTVSGSNSSAETNVSISNPFLHTQEQALVTARMILSTYGGNVIETTGRGDPASEIGDVDTIWLEAGNATAGRRVMQTFQFQNGVMQACRSKFLQAAGAFLYEDAEIIVRSGTWTVPEGVTELRIIIVGGGNGGQAGTDGGWGGMWDGGSAGVDGVDGFGAFVYAVTISVAPGQTFDVVIGKGGAGGVSPGGLGGEGTATTFGTYSSAAGKYFALGYTDIASGNSYARTGVAAPIKGTGDGGKGGKGGNMGHREWMEVEPPPGYSGPAYGHVTLVEPGKGEAGVAGADGCVAVYCDKSEVSV